VDAAPQEGLSLPLSFELDAIYLKVPGGPIPTRRSWLASGRTRTVTRRCWRWRWLAGRRAQLTPPCFGAQKRVRQVVSDDNESIKTTVFGQLPGAEWQRCVVHFERNVLS